MGFGIGRESGGAAGSSSEQPRGLVLLGRTFMSWGIYSMLGKKVDLVSR